MTAKELMEGKGDMVIVPRERLEALEKCVLEYDEAKAKGQGSLGTLLVGQTSTYIWESALTHYVGLDEGMKILSAEVSQMTCKYLEMEKRYFAVSTISAKKGAQLYQYSVKERLHILFTGRMPTDE